MSAAEELVMLVYVSGPKGSDNRSKLPSFAAELSLHASAIT
jgi:hypothetical protein